MMNLSGLDRTITMQIAINTGVDFDTLWESNEYRNAYIWVMQDDDSDLDYLENWVIEKFF